MLSDLRAALSLEPPPVDTRLNALSSIVCFLTKNGVANNRTLGCQSLNALSSIVCFLTACISFVGVQNHKVSQCPLEHCMLSD